MGSDSIDFRAPLTSRPLIVANWKLHGGADFTTGLLSQLRSRLVGVEGIDVVVCPPFVSLALARQLLGGSDIMLGAQHVSDQRQGAYTGEVSAPMLKDVGCDYVIVGHSERRGLYHEDNQSIACRFAESLAANLIPVLCVGETLEQREAGATDRVVASQLAAVADKISGTASWVVAYEPVWAIGTGHVPSIDQLIQVRASIQTHLEKLGMHRNVKVIYGGSITPDNIATLLGIDGIDGGLVGGASLASESFYHIIDKINGAEKSMGSDSID